jgi:hypothetical protein
MTTEIILGILDKVGAPAAAIIVIFWLVGKYGAPLAREAIEKITKAIVDGAAVTAAATEKNTAAVEKQTTAIGLQGERLARMEGLLERGFTREELPPTPLGSRDHDPISLRPRGR